MKFARLLAAKNDDILNAPPVTAAFLGDLDLVWDLCGMAFDPDGILKL